MTRQSSSIGSYKRTTIGLCEYNVYLVAKSVLKSPNYQILLQIPLHIHCTYSSTSFPICRQYAFCRQNFFPPAINPQIAGRK
jgi:hypothetical protein